MTITMARRRSLLVNALKANGFALVLLLLIAVLVIPPVVILIISSFASGRTLQEGHATWENFRGILTDKYTYLSLKDTAIFAVGSSAVAVLLATTLAWLVERTNTPGRKAVYGLLIVSFAVPTFIQGMGWLMFLGPGSGLLNTMWHGVFGGDSEFPIYTMGSMVFIQAMTLLPVMFLLIAPAMRAADPGLEEAAAMSGASLAKTIFKVTLPLIRPALLAALFLSFIISAESFEVPALVGSPAHISVLSTEIYSRINSGFTDYGSASAFSIMMMIFTVLGLINYQRATARSQRYGTIRGKAYRPTRLDLGNWRFPAAVFAVAVPVLVVVPLAMIAWASLLKAYQVQSLDGFKHITTSTYSAVLHDPNVTDGLWHSMVLAVGSAVCVMLITVIAAWLLVRRRSGLTRAVDFLVTLPLVIPAIVLGLAVLRTYLTVNVGIYGTQYIVLLALVVHYLPYGMRYGQAGVVALHPELEEAAQVAGASQSTVLRRILMPLMWPTVLAGGAFVFLATIRQLSLVVFLSGPGYQVATPVMFNRWQYGSICEAGAFAVIIVAMACAALAIFSKLTSGLAIGNPNAQEMAIGK
jgi:iron(III) transport system permease protein